MRAAILILLIISIHAASELTAQNPVQLGSRVRISAPTLGLHNRIGFLDADSVLVIQRGRRLAVSFSSLTRLEVYRGLKPQLGVGVLVGSLINGLKFGIGTAQMCTAFNGNKCGYAGLGGGMVGAALGALIGAWIGSTIKTDDWREIPLVSTIIPQR